MSFTINTLNVSPKSSALKGLTLIKDAAFYMIMGFLIMSIALFSVIPVVFVPNPLRIPATIFSSVIAVALVLIGAVIALIGVYVKLLPGASVLANYNDKYSTPASLLKIGYLWGLILIVIGVITLIAIIGAFLMIIGLILLFIGKIGLIILMFRLSDGFNVSTFMIAGVLFILGLFISILDIMAWIIVYIGSKECIERLRTRLEYIPAPPPI